MKYINKKLLAVGLSLLVCVGCVTGCGSDRKVVFTTGLSGNQLFKIGSACCTMPEIMIYLSTFYNQYADTYGEEMWKYDFGGVSLEEHVKDIVVSKMAQIKIMNLMAEEYKITLTETEESRVQNASQVYYETLSEELKKKENITREVVETVYREYTLANKVYDFITEAADMEISDDEARTVTVQIVYFPNWKLKSGEKVSMEETEILGVRKKAEEMLARLEEGEKFETVGIEYSEEKQLVQNYSRGDIDSVLEEVLFSLDKGECSGLIETADGFYIAKCINTMDYEATQANKLVLAEERRKEAFSKAYNEIASGTYSQFRDQLWEKLSLNKETHSADANFFDIYEEYVKQ